MNNIDNDLPPYYSDHFLIKPLIKFHHQVITTFDCLPIHGKVLEVAKRIVIIAISPFAYLGLGFIALVGLAFHSIWQNRMVRNILPPILSSPTQDLPRLISIASECDQVQRRLISIIDEAKEIDQIQSAIIFIDVECGRKKFSKDVIIKKLDASNLDRDFLSQAAERIFDQAKDFLEIEETAEKLSFKWTALLKDTDGIFHAADDSYSKEGCCTSISRGTASKIDSHYLQECFDVFLEEMGRQKRPLLNEELDFV